MARTNDFVYVFNGGEAYSKISACEVPQAKYGEVVAQRKLTRKLVAQARGADANIDQNADATMTDIEKAVEGRFDTVGQVVLLGRSNGCGLALAVAARLNKKGVNDIAFVGLSDVTLFHYPRSPTITDVGDLKVLNPPKVSLGMRAMTGTAYGMFLSYPAVSGDIPKYKLPTTINVVSGKDGRKVNHYQIEGNSVRKTRHGAWIWWSGMTDGEVHGDLDGFVNHKFSVSTLSLTDLAKHIELNTQAPWKQLCREAGDALADLI